MKDATVLLADDDPAIRTVVSKALSRAGFNVQATDNANVLWNWVSRGNGDLVITDVIMPDENIFDVLPKIRSKRPELPIVVISAQNTLMTAVSAAEHGAYEYLPKPFDLNDLVRVVHRALREPEADMGPPSITDEPSLPIIGRSPAMQEVYRTVARLVQTDLTVMITGESGTGKELVARALHDYSKRAKKAFVAVNMAAIPKELIESELFGHEKGAFTGAVTRASGRFEQAEGGTLFLDEIGDMPFEAQTRLLRVLQEGEFTSVGGQNTQSTNVRIIAATNKDLKSRVLQGLFREDLFYRLNVVPVRLPPLKERQEDIGDLARHFLALSEKSGLPRKSLDGGALAELESYDWPGNVRELENLIKRITALYSEEVITSDVIVTELAHQVDAGETADPSSAGLSGSVAQYLQKYFQSHGDDLPPSGLYARILREVERPLIEIALKSVRGNQIKAAELLGVNRNTLRKKIRDLDIEVVRGVK